MPACPNRFFLRVAHSRQSGMTLVEVLVALLILAIGLMGAAVLQLNALKYTNSARMTSQASFIAYDMLDRIRTNAGADYTWGRAELAPPNTATASVRDLDLHDFEANIMGFAGEDAKGSVVLNGHEVTISISWADARATNRPGARETFTLTSRISNEQGVSQ
ncbi:type IV pilus modification protein PilV [Pseudomonas salmasensis]|uniref:Type IV pilus modification protein PilV n=1 Tax=Pseudomonas salmasensis TaxID=2745514 RepID=A0ABU5FA64_9PSED|nr:type IV pilus modification protein PilV [Pseudomonas salmasensis]MDY4298607.1 type IV pilus modification protein PilV [Pseudomonas salmasensis]